MHPADFDTACRQLQSLCLRDGEPDLVVGIVRGGQYVAQRMFACAPHLMVTMQRHATRYKSVGIGRWLLGHLPYRMLDFMRKAEALHREKHARRRICPVALDDDAIKAISAAHRVLIVDDSVDTGTIMQSVYEAVRHCLADNAHITTAAITVTTAQPAINPDYALYRNHTLIRFPWSNDYKPCDS